MPVRAAQCEEILAGPLSEPGLEFEGAVTNGLHHIPVVLGNVHPQIHVILEHPTYLL